MALGVRDLRDLALPSAWDADYIQQQRMKDGTTYEEVFDTLAGAVAEFNTALADHPWLPLITFQTDDVEVEYREAGGDDWEEHVEYGMAGVTRAQLTGHMLPLKSYEKGLGWTWDFFKDGKMSNVLADIDVLLETALDLHEQKALTRLFQIADDSVGTGYSPGFAYAAVGNVSFTPPDHGGQSFASTHTHYLRYDDTSLAQAVAAMTAHLKEHGHMPPYEMWVADVDKATWAAVSDDTHRVYFRQVQRTDIQYAGTTLAAPTVSDETYIGVFDTPSGVAYVRALTRIPTNYAGMFKPAAPNDRRNPLWWRYNETYGAGIVPINLQKMGHAVNMIVGYTEFGFGVGADRTNGVCLYVNGSGNYTSPTIS